MSTRAGEGLFHLSYISVLCSVNVTSACPKSHENSISAPTSLLAPNGGPVGRSATSWVPGTLATTAHQSERPVSAMASQSGKWAGQGPCRVPGVTVRSVLSAGRHRKTGCKQKKFVRGSNLQIPKTKCSLQALNRASASRILSTNCPSSSEPWMVSEVWFQIVQCCPPEPTHIHGPRWLYLVV